LLQDPSLHLVLGHQTQLLGELLRLGGRRRIAGAEVEGSGMRGKEGPAGRHIAVAEVDIAVALGTAGVEEERLHIAALDSRLVEEGELRNLEDLHSLPEGHNSGHQDTGFADGLGRRNSFGWTC